MEANRIDAKIVNHKSKEVVVLDMNCPWIENREKKDEEMGATRTIPWIYSPSVQYYHGRAWRLVKNYGRRTTDVSGKKYKRCAPKHAEVSSVKYVEYCKDV